MNPSFQTSLPSEPIEQLIRRDAETLALPGKVCTSSALESFAILSKSQGSRSQEKAKIKSVKIESTQKSCIKKAKEKLEIGDDDEKDDASEEMSLDEPFYDSHFSRVKRAPCDDLSYFHRNETSQYEIKESEEDKSFSFVVWNGHDAMRASQWELVEDSCNQ